MSNKLSRRQFLSSCGKLAVGGASFLATMNHFELASAALAQSSNPPTDYRALVCIFLLGGNDAFNMIMPRSNAAYQDYATARQSLAVPQQDILPITPLTAQNAEYGFHPAMTEVQDLFGIGKLGVIANVGPLLAPTSKSQFQNNSVPIPPQLFSHNDQQRHWQTSRPDSNLRNGWTGRVADLLSSVNPSNGVSLNISLSGSNVLQTGVNTIPYNVNSSGVNRFTGLDTRNSRNQRRLDAYNLLLNRQHNHIFAQEFANVQRRAQDNATQLADALDQLTPLQTVFPTSRVGRQLEMVARLIAIRGTTGARRQVFYVGMGGWDTHGEQEQRHPALLSDLSASLKAFYDATVELNIQDNVTTFTKSDFGRTLTSNGDGSDHGWGSHALVMGGCARGQDIYGTMPSLIVGGPDDTRGGRLIPTTSVDEYGATLASWFGVDNNDLDTIFPNLNRFSTRNMGFML